jgi:hypothetical protein
MEAEEARVPALMVVGAEEVKAPAVMAMVVAEATQARVMAVRVTVAAVQPGAILEARVTSPMPAAHPGIAPPASVGGVLVVRQAQALPVVEAAEVP